MHIDPKIVEILKKYQTEINNNDFVSLIAEVYFQCGAKGVGELKELFLQTGMGRRITRRSEKSSKIF